MCDLIYLIGCGGTGKSLLLSAIESMKCHLYLNLPYKAVDKKDTIIFVDVTPKISIGFGSVPMNSPFVFIEQIESNHGLSFLNVFSLLFVKQYKDSEENSSTYIYSFCHLTAFTYYQISIIKCKNYQDKTWLKKKNCNRIIKPFLRRRC